MAAPRKLMLRVQSSDGMQRVELGDSDVTSTLYERVYESFKLNNFGFTLYKDRNRKEEIHSSKSKQLRDYKLQHGDMLYLEAVNGALLFDEPTTSAEANNKPFGEPVLYDSILAPTTSRANGPGDVKEDEVDIQLYKADGKIKRTRDEKLCRHNSNGCCVHCSPLEPFDEAYLREQNIKHMSFHSYMRKLTSGVDRGKFLALDDISCKIKPGCKEHPPWPRGICSKCQPSAVTLNRQVYRHVDNVMLENTNIVERFLAYWRATGHQRVGFLYGQYEVHTDVPLGIRARVAAIYEPPQSSCRDTVQLLPEERSELVDSIASRLGLARVGWIFTDLLSEDVSKGTVQHIRGVDSHFLSAQECIMAGYFQNQRPNACHFASTGYFGSKFVTVCVTGDSSHQVHMEGYQVSGQCMALVRDGCLLPTKDAPELGYIKESSDKQYVPDVYYKEKDAYGNEVQSNARRLPVAYLLVDVPAGLGRGRDTFAPGAAFPPANRPLPGHLQHLKALADHIHAAGSFLQAMSDLHVLVYIATNDALPVSVESLQPLLDAVREQDSEAAERWRRETDSWATLEQLMAASSENDVTMNNLDSGSGGAGGGAGWTCPHCTFDNPANRDTCEICVLPRANNM